MSLPWIVKGDKTSHGGTVIEGAPTFYTEGKQVALLGHMTTCPTCKGGPFPIVTGAPDFVCNGRSVARHGDKTACGASLISGQAVSWWGGETSGKAVPLTIESACDYDEHFVLLDQHNMKPVEGFVYAVTTAKGEQEGRTGADGKTVRAESEKPETVTLKYAVQLQIGIRI
jgi:uncharacterized Zn-binding protein involved in type VI secretion